MTNWKELLISPHLTIRETIQAIENNAMQIAIVVDNEGRLMGTVTDGDVRRGILRGISLEESVRMVLNQYPTVAKLHDSRKMILAMMKLKTLRQIPIIDEDGRVVEVAILDNLLQTPQHDNWVVIMAGGLGTRLAPLTDACPKPLLKVGPKPILETIIESYMEYGFRRFYLAVNYKAEMVKEYFGDGSRYGVEIRYLQEEKRMGTAGALSLIKDRPKQSFIVMNGDLLTKANFQQLIDFHTEHHVQATVCVREYDYQIPYGVVQLHQGYLTAIEEKPIQRCFVSAGMYVLEPEVLDLIPPDTILDMPSLLKRLIASDCRTIAFPIREYWLDIGRKDDFERANGEYQNHFNPITHLKVGVIS